MFYVKLSKIEFCCSQTKEFLTTVEEVVGAMKPNGGDFDQHTTPSNSSKR